ncbi:Type III restriction enzyme, res subunit [Thiorhodovibrio winogradskyi]|uniref:Type III restriction enzyme, res subunit n=1 Tax=Thiorhodovibrio winogradskyi TaxID=77007 RepID=A0ABZ0S8Z2_9GAMM|nr:DEAD/DEAH box helicase family protein [Thiorhodovibrio winogradskyi]
MAKSKDKTHFTDKLALGRWMLEQFGVETLQTFKELLADANLVGFDEENTSLFHYELINKPFRERAMSDETLRLYDENIVRHWRRITERRNPSGSTLYPLYFQYLTLLFTEHYLDRYFSDRAALCADLNAFLIDFNAKLPARERIEDFREPDLNKLAIWIATGGGKTLIMQVNILQFQHYLARAGRAREFNKTILLTPNEGLSLQHKEELDLAGLDGDLFVKDGGSLLSQGTVEIIDIHKLREKAGDVTVAVEAFESNNLVLVDEGHRGAGGEDWVGKRNQLCENGFSFEYSATFGQAIKAAGTATPPKAGKPPSKGYRLVQQYARCILFDYSYKFFHADGYGKDHLILNLSEERQQDQRQLYLSACLLAFYQQKRLFVDKPKDLKPYLLADPLWIFVGGKVTAQNEANAETVSDIHAILRFLGAFVANRKSESLRHVELLLNRQDDLRDQRDRLIFGEAFPYVRDQWETTQADALLRDLMQVVFHATGTGLLHVVHLKGSGGEIGLRVGENDFFGVINVGDAAKLIKQIDQDPDPNLTVTDQAYSASLFERINKSDTTINLLIGAKKFTEGWSSWRVSTMGLMNVGRSEGSEIIQLFGRGVRLKGHNFCLKRSSHIRTMTHPPHIQLLETLNVFGIRSDYMKEFEEYLEEEGVGEKTTKEIILPVIKRLTRNDLQMIRPNKDIPPFRKAERPALDLPPKHLGRVTLNWYPKIQARRSKGAVAAVANVDLNEGYLDARHLAFLDLEALYFAIAQHKNEKAWYNLQLNRALIPKLLADPSWYRLLIPADLLEIRDFARVRIWQEIALALLKKYVERYINYRKAEYEAPHLEYYPLEESHDNFFDAYRVSVELGRDDWIKKLNELKDKLNNKTFRDKWAYGNLEAFDFSRHLYMPLIYIGKTDVVKLSPVALNEGERDFVQDLKHYHSNNADFFADKELYLLRNQSRGKGIGFFEAGNFYPDFILWLITDTKQYVAFVDPKGLGRVHGLDDPKIQFHAKIKEIEQRLGDPNVVLNSFIVSNTDMKDISWWVDGGATKQDFTDNHVLFQQEDKDTYVSVLLAAASEASVLSP